MASATFQPNSKYQGAVGVELYRRGRSLACLESFYRLRTPQKHPSRMGGRGTPGGLLGRTEHTLRLPRGWYICLGVYSPGCFVHAVPG